MTRGHGERAMERIKTQAKRGVLQIVQDLAGTERTFGVGFGDPECWRIHGLKCIGGSPPFLLRR